MIHMNNTAPTTAWFTTPLGHKGKAHATKSCAESAASAAFNRMQQWAQDDAAKFGHTALDCLNERDASSGTPCAKCN